ncbi:DUF1553 domain-containing protein [Fuerstiella marisgermanici]|uniref:Planctomycete cytochrome C n=1 Tax=Fuerstiella marisgermanici TaxID=1891926 RepID=A0A1P8WB56_9PLAN|nr:DUF1553 domain-containing protein [Fuerstiella marisgermanici]APZ91294.1 Planctomycete cytochrome C [Fuerstiella marisgermanici]
MTSIVRKFAGETVRMADEQSYNGCYNRGQPPTVLRVPPVMRHPALLIAACCLPAFVNAAEIDFNKDVRPIFSNKCLLCHGPDPEGLQAGLRLDDRKSATAELDSGETAIVPGKPELSELIARITTDDEDLRMPPADHGAKLSPDEIAILKQWVSEGAKFAVHWSYVKPQRPQAPPAPDDFADWVNNPVDQFILDSLTSRGLQPSPAAEKSAIARRVFLDLTGLPPTIEEVDAFVASEDPLAYEKLVDDLLQRPAFGEHWARKWLDLARYADSAGYADDPARTIWAYRDWVIKAMNENMPFDQFTIEQMAGDLLPDAAEHQLIATAFHRNTLTNNEGGTQDEEFRNVAVVDRVNTTMAVWMGTTMACAQCHTHKYDPITQEEYFQFFAIMNSTQDADKRDDSPLLEIFTDAQKQQQRDLRARIADLKSQLATPTPELAKAQKLWENALRSEPTWTSARPTAVKRNSEQPIGVTEDGVVAVDTETLEALPTQDTYVVDVPVAQDSIVRAVRLSTVPDASLPAGGSGHSGGNFVITGLKAEWVPTKAESPQGRFVRITQHGKNQILSLAEVQVFSDEKNVALNADATQHSTDFSGPAKLAVDGTTDGNFENKSVTHSKTEDNPFWEVDLGKVYSIDRIAVWNRTDNDLQKRLNNYSVTLLDEELQEVWSQRIKEVPDPSIEIKPTNVRSLKFSDAVADYHQPNFEPAEALTGSRNRESGWAVGGSVDKPHHLVASLTTQLEVDSPGTLRITIEHNSPHARHLLGRFRLSTTDDPSATARASIPAEILAIADQPADKRSAEDAAKLASHYRNHKAGLSAGVRNELKATEAKLAAIKPATSVPVLRELAESRETHLQFRGSYLDKGPKLEPGLPAAFHEGEANRPLDRLAMAEWLISEDNPLTARVLANRYWETIFGRGIVLTSEEFGSQGEPPTHPRLLDWLATEVIQSGWNRKHMLRILVTSATYRQSAKVSAEKVAADPDNRWLSRGPRIRLSAEMVRDQALFVSGLLSSKMYGPPVNPPQPDLGLKAAFGSSTDWKTSEGEDRYRRGIYTTWRRSNPYPSMATFDAPNREVCTVRRNSSNTPLQSLVTLNDPVYVEAAQSLARVALEHSDDVTEQVTHAFRRCTLRSPTAGELAALVALFEDSKQNLATQPDDAMQLATNPLGELPDGMAAIDAAAMTVVGNVLLNLDEMFLKR